MSEWITDRLPTEADGDEKFRVWCTSPDGDVFRCYYSLIGTGEAWAPKPKTVKPAPYVKPEPQRWKPETNQWYYCATEYGDIQERNYSDNVIDGKQYNFGNCFQTSAQAQEAARRVRELLLNYHKELNNE
jgi:hypothetical protein